MHRDFTFINGHQQRLMGRDWPVSNPKAVLVLVHGQGEHCGRYAHVAAWFNARQIALIGFDQQGHGRSEGARGSAHSLNALLDDIGQMLDVARERYPGIPLFLYGHSMGGQLALNYTLFRTPAIQGAIITSPWIRLAFEPPASKVALARLLQKITPHLTLPNGLAVHFLSHDPAVIRAYREDPLVHNRISTAAGMALLMGAERLQQHVGSSPLPILLMHGGADRITSCKASAEFAERVEGVVWREWPGLYHEMHNETDQEALFETMLDWLRQHGVA